MLRSGVIAADCKVVVISTAHGLKFTDFKTRYHHHDLEEFRVKPEHGNGPLEVEADYEKVRGAVLKAVEQKLNERFSQN